MKKALAFLLLAATLLASCAKKADEQPAAEDGASAEKKAVTFMVYMVGSDLEAKGGAGSDDLLEIAESGVDLSKSNVLVYAGGSKKWHNDNVSKDDGHTLLSLGADGFSKALTYEDSSMGESEPLARFLNYAYENYPADEFALVMWDHGDGPLIGYGKDMIFDNDSLTLAEMRDAFSKSPFKGDAKLSWIGFDACLMSSAELAIVLSDHSKYLVASQEIEPAFGWNYSFLAGLGKGKTDELLSEICTGYLSECEKYYERKGYEGRDTTLAAMDLSAAGELESAINALFAECSSDVNKKYNTLAANRASSRALGRASTGSEYDLVDLYDLADKMSAVYGDEADRVKAAARKLVIKNSTNAEGLCGLSIYYPFYNKSYYEKSWAEVYRGLGVLDDYAGYLDDYSKIWLGGDFVEENATSKTPEEGGRNQYVLDLTDSQAETFAGANYYILCKEGDGLYTAVYASSNVERDDTTLTATFDGDILYAKNDLGNYMLPVTVEHDTVGDITRYSVYVNLTNETPLLLDKPDGFKSKTGAYRFQIGANSETKDITTSALVPYNSTVDADSLAGGKLEDADISQYSTYYFTQQRHRYLERYDNGAIKPVSEWTPSSYLSAYTSRVGDGLEFTFAPLPEGEFFLIFEIEDTQGSKFCSEVIPVTSKKHTVTAPAVEYKDVEWESGKKVKLGEENDVEFYLTTIEYYGKTKYALEVKNNNDFKIAVLGYDLMCNGNVYCYDGSLGSFSVEAEKTAIEPYGFDFGNTFDAELLSELASIQFAVKAVTFEGDKTVVPLTGFYVELSDSTTFVPQPDTFSEGYYVNSDAVRDVLATDQTVFSRDGLKLTLIGLGGSENSYDDKMVLTFCIENNSRETKHLAIEGITFDDIHIDFGVGPISLPAGAKMYKATVIAADKLDKYMIDSPRAVSLQIRHMKYATLEGGGGFSEVEWYPVELSEKGSGCDFEAGRKTLLSEKGLKLTLKETVADKDDSMTPYEWTLTVENETGEDIAVEISNLKVNGQTVDIDRGSYFVALSGGKCPDTGKTLYTVSMGPVDGDEIEVSFDVDVYDFKKETLLWTSKNAVELTAKL